MTVNKRFIDIGFPDGPHIWDYDNKKKEPPGGRVRKEHKIGAWMKRPKDHEIKKSLKERIEFTKEDKWRQHPNRWKNNELVSP